MGGRGVRERRGRSGQRANLTPNPSSIVAHLHSSSEALSSLFLSFHRSAVLYLTLTISMLHVSSSSRLYLSPSRFSFPLLGVLVYSFSLCFTPCRLALSIHRVLIFSFSPSYYPSSRPNFQLIRVLMCYPLLSMCSPTASLGNRAVGGQRASTH